MIVLVLKNAKEIAKSGVKEIVLTGINVVYYGKPTHTFFLLMESLDKVEPNLLNNDIIRLVSKSKIFVPHFHIPLQSGSNEILRSMHRRYLRDLYAEKVENIKYFLPHACIVTMS